MTKENLLELVENIFGNYGLKTVSRTDINKSAYVPNMPQKRVFEAANIDPMDRSEIVVKELFTNRPLTISYYATLREGANRTPEPRMGLTDLITYMSVGDEILFTRDENTIFIYNLSNLEDLDNNESENEESLCSQINIDLLRDRASNINTRPNQESRTINSYPRNSILRAYIKERSNYSCEMPNCDYVGFEKENGQKYIEVHHVEPLFEGGEDSMQNTAALCPTCHRKLHYAENKEEMKVELLSFISTLG